MEGLQPTFDVNGNNNGDGWGNWGGALIGGAIGGRGLRLVGRQPQQQRRRQLLLRRTRPVHHGQPDHHAQRCEQHRT